FPYSFPNSSISTFLPSSKKRELSLKTVFLLSLMAGNSGINLTNANYVFLMEPWWNKAVQQQAIDRIHRIGQDQKVFAYNMIRKDTIEEKLWPYKSGSRLFRMRLLMTLTSLKA